MSYTAIAWEGKPMRTVKEASRLTGVSVRTLHHYDAIGLLKPTKVTEAGYRLYDDAALARLQTILLFRELQFPLKEIKVILESPEYSREEALKQQIALLELERARLGKLISFAHEILTTGGNTMDFSAFDKAEIEQYAAEAKARWGQTTAYQEYAKRRQTQTGTEAGNAAAELMQVFSEMGKLRQLAPESDEAQALVETLRQRICERYYPCTPETLQCLGQIYSEDSRFRDNIDACGGAGTAAFASRAIALYCEKKKASGQTAAQQPVEP